MTTVQSNSRHSRAAIRQPVNTVAPVGLITTVDGCTAGSSDLAIDPMTHQRLILLSNRETEVLQLIVSGLTNKATSLRLGISIKTVEKHRGNLMKKLGVLHLPDLMRVWLQAHPEELTMTG